MLSKKDVILDLNETNNWKCSFFSKLNKRIKIHFIQLKMTQILSGNFEIVF